MSISQSPAEILGSHVTLETESIDRMYLNLYVPGLQTPERVAGFFRHHRGERFASSALMGPMSRRFVECIERYAEKNRIPIVKFEKWQRKEDVASEYRNRFRADEGVLFIGKAQEKMTAFRTEKRWNEATGHCYPWIIRSTAMVNQYYFYCMDRDFGMVFFKFSSYFPYTGRLYLNGHEYAKRQLAKEKIEFESLDNGFLSCTNPTRLQEICSELGPKRIDALARKWLRVLPHPFTREDREAGYRYDISILQAEFSLTQVLDRPLSGRLFFEHVIRENIDVGRPDMVQLIFSRRITKRTPGRFRTRIITDGVIPSLHVNYKDARIKQYFKEGRALRTETTINNARDFSIGKRLHNLPLLCEIGFTANRRLLDVQSVSHDCFIGEDALQQVVRPVVVDGQRASALPFDSPRVHALLSALVLFVFQSRGFANKDLRGPLAMLLGVHPDSLTRGKMTYELRRLRLHGIISRIRGSHRYNLSPFGLRVSIFFSRVYSRVLRPSMAPLSPVAPPASSTLRQAFDRLETLIAQSCCDQDVAMQT